ncbi:MAG: aromatic ring-hydroxylating dioxygenase subunit alpha [Nitrospirae bacterium]|nr:aromatic ring-hydroxylating dioxygenase subunit alpha [Nitrospirota bacterium]
MLEGFWYIATQSRHVRFDRPTAVALLNQPIVLLRDRSRAVYALEDRCAHRGVPLSAGWQEDDSIRCRYHGWRFAASGECLEVPALANGTVPKSACVRSYPVREQDGWVWVYIGNDRCLQPTAPPPALPAPPDGSRMVSTRVSVPVKVRMDFAVDSLVDPAHVPFVHNRFFRQQHVAKLKEKEFTRLPLGFRTVSNNVKFPNTFVFRALTPGLALARTTVDFLLPGIHLETLEVGKRFGSIMLIATPLTTEVTRLDITVGWNFLRWAPLAWVVRLTARTTLSQDREILELQEQGNLQKTTMNVGLEHDTMAVWYRRLQKYHLDQLAGVPNLAHPVPEKTTLRWTT